MKKREGFTILEVLFTIVIMTIALWALSALQASSIGYNYSSHQMTIATILAQDKMEELRNIDWADAQLVDNNAANFTVDQNGDGTPDDFRWTVAVDHTNADGVSGIANPIDENGQAQPANRALGGYSRDWNIADNQPTTYMKTIAIRVRWGAAANKSVIITSVRSQG
jgi:prepilin-type N-terminal cleavage/methylation domain-containing protein